MGQLYAITPLTLLDYPGEMACIAWFSGCNLRCAYCHNPGMVLGRGEKDDGELTAFLERRRGLLTAVVFSGGEATYCPSLPELMGHVRELGYKIKLDTNGAKPRLLARLAEAQLLDYVALDYKCPPVRAKELLGTAKYVKSFEESLQELIEYSHCGLKLEIRTTFHADLMTEEDLSFIIEDLDQRNYRGTYYIQNISSYGEKTLGNIDKPSRKLMRHRLPVPRNFDVQFRNFPKAHHLIPVKDALTDMSDM